MMPNKPTTLRESLPEQLHIWYLEAVKELHPESFNPNANKPYTELTDEQKFLDKYIADKIIDLLTSHNTELIRKIEGMKKSIDGHSFLWKYESAENQEKASNNVNCFNEALDEVINLIKHD